MREQPPRTEHVVAKLTGLHASVVDEVASSTAENDIVVVGMSMNPNVKRARKALDAAGLSHTYLGYGGYTSQWKPRLAIKLWSGWPTFPQVFVKGQLIGGADETQHMLKSGALQELLSEGQL